MQAIDSLQQAVDSLRQTVDSLAGARDTAAADTATRSLPFALPEWSDATAWALPLVFIIVGALVGVFVERVVVRQLRKITTRTEWEWDDILLRSLKRAPTLLLTAAGTWAATQLLPLQPGVESTLEKALMVLVIFSVTLITARASAEAIKRYAARAGTSLPASSLVQNIAKLVVLVLGLVIILANLGINVTALVTGLGIGGIAVALALQSTLANAFAGFQIIATRQVRDGDYVRLESGEEGNVVDIRWRNTTIKALYDDHEVIVPNAKLVDSILINYSLPARAIWMRIPVGVHYGSDLEHVERVTQEVAEEVWRDLTRAREGDEPVTRYQDFGDSAITFSCRILVDRFQDQYPVRHEFIKRLHRRYGQEGIVIPWPIRTLHLPEPVAVARPDAPAGGDGEPAGREGGDSAPAQSG